jgi:hypothetical protein
MTEEEYFRKTYPDYCYGDRPLSPHFDFFQFGVEFGEQQSEKKIEELEKENAELEKKFKAEQDLNAEIKARFVKCNTCTPDMKEKCLMFNENLCEGERCEELVDLMSLVDKRDTDDKLSKAVNLLKRFVEWGSNRTNLYVDDILVDTYSLLEEV